MPRTTDTSDSFYGVDRGVDNTRLVANHDSDAIEMRVRSWIPYIQRRRYDRYQFKIGDSCGQPVIANEWILGPNGSMARVDGGDPGDENDGE